MNQRRKSICFLTSRYRDDNKEAISKNLKQICINLSKDQNLDICLVTPTPAKGVKNIHFFKELKYTSMLGALKSLFKLCHFLKKNHGKYDIINFHIATPIEAFVVWVLLSKNIRGKTILTYWQAYLSGEEFLRKIGFFTRNLRSTVHTVLFNSFLCGWTLRLSLRGHQKIIVQSHYQKRQLEKLSTTPVYVIENSVVFSRDSRNPQKKGDPFRLLYVGHLKSSKGVYEILGLVHTLRTKHNLDIHLDMLLSGKEGLQRYLKEVKRLGLESVVKYGFDEDLQESLERADCLIVLYNTLCGTSLYPNVLIEAMACGTPILTTKSDLTKELITPDCGILLDENNLDTVVNFIDNSKERERMSLNLKSLYQERFSFTDMIRKYQIALLDKEDL